MNMGIGDAVDLGWKMAARLAGWGGDALLASYELERRKVHIRTIAEAVANFKSTSNQLVQPALEEAGPVGEATRREVADIILATKVREFKTLGIVLGMRYEDSPIVVDDGSVPPQDHFMLYLPSAHPGCLAPHLWLCRWNVALRSLWRWLHPTADRGALSRSARICGCGSENWRAVEIADVARRAAAPSLRRAVCSHQT